MVCRRSAHSTILCDGTSYALNHIVDCAGRQLFVSVSASAARHTHQHYVYASGPEASIGQDRVDIGLLEHLLVIAEADSKGVWNLHCKITGGCRTTELME